jgi:hypothetical protein
MVFPDQDREPTSTLVLLSQHRLPASPARCIPVPQDLMPCSHVHEVERGNHLRRRGALRGGAVVTRPLAAPARCPGEEGQQR